MQCSVAAWRDCATVEARPMDGDAAAAVREVVGESVPVLATLDLHGNVSAAMGGTPTTLGPPPTRMSTPMNVAPRCAHALRGHAGDRSPLAPRVRQAAVHPACRSPRTQSAKPGANTPYGDIIHYGQSILKTLMCAT